MKAWNLSSITREELDAARASLSVWQSPNLFREVVDALVSKIKIKSRELFNRPQLHFVMDALVLAKYVTAYPPTLVRLSSEDEQWPDGHRAADPPAGQRAGLPKWPFT